MRPTRIVGAATVIIVLLSAAVATAQRYSVDSIDVEAVVRPDGAMDIRETIAYDLRGSFTFAFRDIPRGETTRLDAIRVFENGRAYTQSASKAPGTFEVTDRGRSTRIQWY